MNFIIIIKLFYNMSLEQNNLNFQTNINDIYKIDESNQIFSQLQKDFIYKILYKELTREVLNIKDDISKKFFDYDNKMMNYVNELENKIVNLNEKWNRLFEDTNTIKVKIEKTEYLENKMLDFQNLIGQHDIRINNLIKDLNDACFKYDKMFLNNLQVPGQIGDCCKWKNLKEYLIYTMKEFNLLDAYKQKNQMNFQSYKDKLDLITGKLNNQVDNFLKTSFEYTTNKIEDIKKELNFQIELVNSQLPKLSLENSNFANILNKEITELINERENLKQLQIDFNIQLNNHFEQISIKEKETIQKIGEYKLEFAKIKKNFTQLSEFIKDVRFRRNINDDEMMNNQINKLVTNLKKNEEENVVEKKGKKKFKNVESIIKQIISGKKIVKKDSNTSIKNENPKTNFEIATNNDLKKDKEIEEKKENEEKEEEKEEERDDEREGEKTKEEEKISDNIILINNEQEKGETQIINNIQNKDLILKNAIITNIEGNKLKNNIYFNNNMYTNNYFNQNQNNYNNQNQNYNNQNQINYNNQNQINYNNQDPNNYNNQDQNNYNNQNQNNYKKKNDNDNIINNIDLYNSTNNNLDNKNNLLYINLDYNNSKNNSNINNIINSYNNIEKNNNGNITTINNKIRENEERRKLSMSFNNNLNINLNSNDTSKNEEKSISREKSSSKRYKYKKLLKQESEEESKNNKDLIPKIKGSNEMNLKKIQSKSDNKIQKVDLKKINDYELNNEKIIKNEEKEKIYSSDKVIEEINGHYILTDNYHIDKNLPNLNLPKFKNYKKFPPSKIKSKNIKKSTFLNNSDNIIEEKPLFELRSEGVKYYKNKKNSPGKLIVEKYDKKRNEDKISGDIYHNRSMKFLKPLKNSFIKIPQTNLNNPVKKM